MNPQDISLEERKARLGELFPIVERIKSAISTVIVGQDHMISRLIIGLLSNGHVLLEGAPGLAKTLSVRALASSIGTRFQRVQFTPDLLPADLVGTELYSQKEGTFSTRKGPIFTNILLADEINRAPPKVQSALLEAMAEKQVTIGGVTYPLKRPFLVLATQNPLEQEGTYPLPEAQADRFMFKILVSYPSLDEERAILKQSWNLAQKTVPQVSSEEDIVLCQDGLEHVKVQDSILNYILRLVRATRDHEATGLGHYIEFGASPRASLALLHASRAHAFLCRRAYVTPDDVKMLAADVLRHRIVRSYEAQAEGIHMDWLLRQILQKIRTP